MHDYDNGFFILNDEIINLTPMENELLNILLLNKGYIVSYNKMCRAVFGHDEDKALRTNLSIHKLRLERKTHINIFVRAGAGYMIEDNSKISSKCKSCAKAIADEYKSIIDDLQKSEQHWKKMYMKQSEAMSELILKCKK